MIQKICSGGQTGVDRAALDAARMMGFTIGGFCPKDGLAEDYTHAPGLLAVYPELAEMSSSNPAIRTKKNVACSDATLIIALNQNLNGGTLLTYNTAKKLGKPVMIVYPSVGTSEVLNWLDGISSLVGVMLNVAGPRASKAPGIYDFAYDFVSSLLREVE